MDTLITPPLSLRWGSLILAATLLIPACNREEGPAVDDLPRPVRVVTLEQTNPSDELVLTGSAESWKQENLSFEVPGKVEWVIDVDTDVVGEADDNDGRRITDGTVLARIDDADYQIAVREAEADLRAARAKMMGIQAELDRVIPAERRAAEAELERASEEYERMKKIRASGSVSQREFLIIEAKYKSAEAAVERIDASRATTEARLEATRAEAERYERHLERAKRNVERCALVAPFSGRVEAIYAIPGSYVNPGQPVLRVVMMDPIKVEVAVSPETDRLVNESDVVTVYPPGAKTEAFGAVLKKDTVADPNTRTFKVTVLTRNALLQPDTQRDPTVLELPRIDEILTLQKAELGETGPMYAEETTLYRGWPTKDDWYVWKVLNYDPAMGMPNFTPRLKIRRVQVVPGEKRLSYIGLLTWRELKDAGPLRPRMTVAAGVPDSVKGETAEVAFIRERWQFRPGDLVKVHLTTELAGEGLYVPMEAVTKDRGQHVVYVVDRDEQTRRAFARRVPVTLESSFGDRWRITGETLEPGQQIVVEGVHYLTPGQAIATFLAEAGS